MVTKHHRYSDALRQVAPHLAQHEHGPEFLRILAETERNQDEYDPAGWATAESVYYVGSLWHGGQWCPLYAALCATEFHPGPCWRSPEDYFARNAAAAMLRILRKRD
jgi:hypothetical protein